MERIPRIVLSVVTVVVRDSKRPFVGIFGKIPPIRLQGTAGNQVIALLLDSRSLGGSEHRLSRGEILVCTRADVQQNLCKRTARRGTSKLLRLYIQAEQCVF